MAVRHRLTAAGLSILLAAALAAPLTTAAAAKPFRMNLGDRTDFVRQYDPNWCIAASMQMMLNIVLPRRNDASQKTQTALIELARSFKRSARPPARHRPSRRTSSRAARPGGVGRWA